MQRHSCWHLSTADDIHFEQLEVTGHPPMRHGSNRASGSQMLAWVYWDIAFKQWIGLFPNAVHKLNGLPGTQDHARPERLVS